ncbi:hypothetical protein GCM10010277_22360 [Streptomyces longisporoflavus]|uniref:DUF4232 domain-containing protein n=1 Tax=Streptomyces longisporoflavus TaxID=28044 RepID=UPI0019AD5EED|nr:DUF4232 domain-containing protein [Streptomyces longisporoflavus]GGV36120.1 hypothetical protein GCM10010277_22360 [Streptomyces longisporoflavus]
MTVIPFRRRSISRFRHAAVLSAVALLATGCGLSEELEREGDPGRTAPAQGGRSDAAGGRSDSADPVPTTEASAEMGPGEVPDVPSPSCPASGVRIEPGMVDAAMGLRAMSVTLTNCGKDTYRLKGYPKLRVLDEHREPLDVQILEGTAPIMTRDDDPGPDHSVSLKTGEAAYTVLVWRNTVTDTTTTAVSGTYLKVTPVPGARSGTVTPQGRIDLGNTGRIGTTAWQREPADDTAPSRPTAPAPSTPGS